MATRKLYADKIFDGNGFRENEVLLVEEDGCITGFEPLSEAGPDITFYNGTICPGLVNVHCHLELSHLKGVIPERSGLVNFVLSVVHERQRPEVEIMKAIDMAEREMLANGIVAVGDICNNGLTISQKRKEQLSYYNFIEASGWHPLVSASRFERAIDISRVFEAQLPGSNSSIVPHAPYSVSGDLWKLVMPQFKGRIISMHNQESPEENLFFTSGEGDLLQMFKNMKISNDHFKPSGSSSLQTVFHHLTTADQVILVHNNFISQADIDHIHNVYPTEKIFYCICINANQYIEGVVPPVDLLIKNGCNLVLGTDSLASNHSLNIMDEIKTLINFFPAIEMKTFLSWATLNGAKALGMDENIGSFERGKKPGVILFDNDLNVKRLM